MSSSSFWSCALVRLSLVVFAAFPFTSFAAPSPSPSPASSAPAPQSTVCGDIVNSGNSTFDAKVAYDCLISVPFNPAVATEFIKYYNDTVQFQSNLAYLKNPPSSYQQPPVDLLQGLVQIQQDVDHGAFPNQYAFEATLQDLIYSTHDAHLSLSAGVLAVFTFASPYGITSVSIDGIQTPKVYITDDLVDTQVGGESWQPSAISSINGQGVTEFLEQFAGLNAIGTLEPNADWNQLMSSPVLDIQALYSVFEGAITFYPGESITFVFENGTQVGPEPWLAIYNSQGDTGPLATGGDFYNFFVLGLLPASYNDTAVTSDSGPGAAATSSSPAAASSTTPESASSTASSPPSWSNPAYPTNPDVAQPDLGDTGVLSGYFLHDISTAVLSIPSFQAEDEAVQEFSDTVGNFLNQSKQAGMQKVLIDVQQNLGGDTFLAIDAFKQFFPSIEPFAGSRLRAHPTADVLGNTFTNFYNTPLNDSLYYGLTTSDWVATALLDANTGQNFSLWGELFGPHSDNGDLVTTVERYNLSSFIYDVIASGGIEVYGYNDRPATSPQPYATEDIVILSDALCYSACALFMELMHHEAGVKTVVAGGRPINGPMQAPSGSRGAEEYSTDELDGDIEFAIQINSSTASVLPDRTEAFYITSASFSIRDQIRKGEDVPLQFVYEAANCRIYYTPSTFYNFTNLWTYAANAIWTNSSLCVPGSTGFATDTTSTDTTGPPGSNPSISHNITAIIDSSGVNQAIYTTFGGQELDSVSRANTPSGTPCQSNAGCSGGTTCTTISTCGKSFKACVQTCTTFNTVCGNRCQFPPGTSSKNNPGKPVVGYCPPQSVNCGPVPGRGTVALNNPGLPGIIDSAQRVDDELLIGGSVGANIMAGIRPPG